MEAAFPVRRDGISYVRMENLRAGAPKLLVLATRHDILISMPCLLET